MKKNMKDGKSPRKSKISAEDKKEQTEYILKYLLRCRNMHEAKHQIVKILLKMKQREAMLNHLEDTLDQMSSDEAKATYFILLKVSFRIYGSIDRLRVDHPMLNRPFIFAGWNLQNQMIKQTLNLRYNLKKRYESLRDKDQIDRILDKTGRIIKICELTTLNKEIENQSKEQAAPDDPHIRDGLSTKQKQERKIQRRITLEAIRDLDILSERSDISF